MEGYQNTKKRKQKSKKNSRVFFNTTFFCPLSKKPLGVRMGKGVGSTDHWVCPSNKSRVVLEFSRQKLRLPKMQKILKNLAKKTKLNKIIFSRIYTRREQTKKEI